MLLSVGVAALRLIGDCADASPQPRITATRKTRMRIERLLLPNARVQLRAVGSICGLVPTMRRSEYVHNRNAWSARQLQRVLARAEYGGCDEPWPAGGALNEC